MAKFPDEIEHISYLKVENFKKFKSLRVENLGDFNLIVGDNNSGKSSLLEALLVEKDILKFLYSLKQNIVEYKNFKGLKEPYLKEYLLNRDERNEAEFSFDGGDKKSKQTKVVVRFGANKSGQFYIATDISGDYYNQFVRTQPEGKMDVFYLSPDILYNSHFPLSNLDSVPLIPFNQYYKNIVGDLYYTYIEQSKQARLSFKEDLKLLISDIEDIRPNPSISSDSSSVITIQEKERDETLPLATYGDGAIKMFRILLEIALHKNKKLMIDEIDTGIYFGKMKDFWKVVLVVAKRNKVQLFATTHNKECISAYRDAIQELGSEFQSKARIVQMVNMLDKSVSTNTLSYEAFNHALENENEVR